MASSVTAQELASLVLVFATTGCAIAGLTLIPDWKSPEEKKEKAENYEYIMKKALDKQFECKQTPPPKRT